MTTPPKFSRRGFLGSATGVALAAATTGAGTVAATGTAQAEVGTLSTEFAFAHPGILHTAEDLDRMRTAVAAQREPIYQGYQALAADSHSSADYTAANTGQITTWGRGPYNYQNEAPNDAAAAYQNALMWYITQQDKYGDKARDILNVWAKSLTGITGADGELGAGLQGFKLVNAAEILRHGGYAGWAAEDIARCEDSFRDVWYKSLSGYALFANGNWDLAAMQTVIAVAVFCDDRVMFEDAVRFAAAGAGNGSITHRVVNAAGQGQESGRDQTHEQLAVGLLSSVAQVAWNQGVDLFSFAGNRILAGAEYDAKYNLGNDVAFTADLDRTGKYIKTSVSNLVRGISRPIYELVYAHYATVKGLDTPYTEQAVFRDTGGARHIEGYDEDHPSFGTLTCARETPSTTAPSTVPGAPAGLSAVNEGDGVQLTWVGSVDPAGATAADSYTVRRSTSIDGTYDVLEPELTDTSYEDLDVETGVSYFYTVQAVNAVGTSLLSLPVASTPGLPDAWTSRDIGSVKKTGVTSFDGERFVLEAGGSDIAGTADSFRYASVKLTGDGSITARLVYPLSSQYSKSGVMMRTSTGAGSAHASMLIQGLTLHTWSGVWTTRGTSGGATSGTGSTPVPPAQQDAISTAASYPISNLGSLPDSATPLTAPHVEAAGDGYRLRMPYWVRLVREGDTFTGSISPDGATWTEVGSTELDLGTTVYVGLAHTSCLGISQSYAEKGTAAFDNVTVISGTDTQWQVPAPVSTPSGLSAVKGTSAVELSWSGEDLAGRYTVRRADSKGGRYKTIATDVGPVGFGVHTHFADATGKPGTTYHYTVAKTNAGGAGLDSTVAAAKMPRPPAPRLTSASSAYANVGEPFSYLIGATNNPVKFAAPKLPHGLRLDSATGLISGTPTGNPGTSKVKISASNATATDTATLTLTVASPPPAPWAHQDIGDYVLDERQLGAYGVVAISTPGSAGYDATDQSFTVRGAGTSLNVNGQGTTAQYVHLPVTGDITFTARVAGRVNAGNDDQVGLLMTQSLSPFGQLAGAFLTSTASDGGGVKQFVRRKIVAGGISTTDGSSGVPEGTWLRLARSGNKFTASTSADGTTWSVIGRDTIAAFGKAAYYVGLAVTSRKPSALGTAVFDNVTVEQGATTVLGQPVVDPYKTFSSATDTTALYGQSGTDLAIQGGGADLWGTLDQYSSIYLTGAVTDGSTVTVAVTSQDPVNAWTKSGIMIRNDITGTASPGYLILAVSPGHGVALQWDKSGDGQVDSNIETDGTTVYPTWLKLVRSGTTFTGSYSTDGSTWTTVGTATVSSAGTTQDAGVFTSSHVSGSAGEADFSEFLVV
ncbi:putative Ig domain-containing protein [Streptomyces sp. NPDC051665]|uniref:putative Ig domain-containing protein n=1 Tax=Streptomyces sp. NPDC051665 TaxID=3154647 RepID=UPI00342F0404